MCLLQRATWPTTVLGVNLYDPRLVNCVRLFTFCVTDWQRRPFGQLAVNGTGRQVVAVGLLDLKGALLVVQGLAKLPSSLLPLTHSLPLLLSNSFAINATLEGNNNSNLDNPRLPERSNTPLSVTNWTRCRQPGTQKTCHKRRTPQNWSRTRLRCPWPAPSPSEF